MAEALGLSRKQMKKPISEAKVKSSVPWMFYENPTPTPAKEESPFLAHLEATKGSAFEDLLQEDNPDGKNKEKSVKVANFFVNTKK